MTEMGLNLAEQLRLAASGDIEAQRQFVQEGIDCIRNGQCDPVLGFNSVLIWARIAAARGDLQDRIMLAGCLCGAANLMRQEGHDQASDTLVAEAVVILERAADDGSEIGADCLNHLIDNLPPHVAAAAKMIKEAA